MTRLTPKQHAIIDDLFAGDITTDEILEKHKLNRTMFNKYLTDETFRAEFTHRIEWLNMQSQAIIARYATLAAAKLVELTSSKSQETRRKACLDIISLPKTASAKDSHHVVTNDDTPETLPPDTAAKLLECLAESKKS